MCQVLVFCEVVIYFTWSVCFRVIQVQQPLLYNDLVIKIQQYYGQNLLMRCKVSTGQVSTYCHQS